MRSATLMCSATWMCSATLRGVCAIVSLPLTKLPNGGNSVACPQFRESMSVVFVPDCAIVAPFLQVTHHVVCLARWMAADLYTRELDALRFEVRTNGTLDPCLSKGVHVFLSHLSGNSVDKRPSGMMQVGQCRACNRQLWIVKCTLVKGGHAGLLHGQGSALQSTA